MLLVPKWTWLLFQATNSGYLIQICEQPTVFSAESYHFINIQATPELHSNLFIGKRIVDVIGID